MADVQAEKGFTKIADEILEAMARIKLSPTQYRVLFIVWRYTYGFNRKEHNLSLGFIAKATGCDKRQLQREIKKLEERNIIHQNIKNGSYRIIKFNKNYDEWLSETIGETTIGEIDNGETTDGEITNTTIGETVNGTIGEIDNQDIQKTNLKTINNIRQKQVYDDKSIPFRLAKYLLDNIKEFKPDIKKPDLQKWSDDMRKLVDIDKRDPKQISDVISWTTRNSFWQSNILSASKLREKYDSLSIQMKKESLQGGGNRGKSFYNPKRSSGIPQDELESLYEGSPVRVQQM